MRKFDQLLIFKNHLYFSLNYLVISFAHFSIDLESFFLRIYRHSVMFRKLALSDNDSVFSELIHAVCVCVFSNQIIVSAFLYNHMLQCLFMGHTFFKTICE